MGFVRKSNVAEGNGGNWSKSNGTNADDCEWVVKAPDDWSTLGVVKSCVENPKLFFSEYAEDNKYSILYQGKKQNLEINCEINER